jgi:hypothetical protein
MFMGRRLWLGYKIPAPPGERVRVRGRCGRCFVCGNPLTRRFAPTSPPRGEVTERQFEDWVSVHDHGGIPFIRRS